jgi:hypothetical protein
MKLTERKKAKELLKEIAIESMIEQAQRALKENEELKAQLELLKPSKKEERRNMNYIG